MIKNESGNKTVWKRNLMKFDEKLEFVSRIEGPKWIENETVTREHLCIALNGYIYLCVTGDTFSALYELTTDGQWTELCHKRSSRFSYIQVGVWHFNFLAHLYSIKTVNFRICF